MDLAYYPNIAAKADELGGVKKTVFNKKLLEQADASWRQFSSEEIARIEQEAPSAVKVGNCFVTPTAILHMGRNQHALFAIPVRDVIETAKKVLYTGHIGDGKIFVYDVENVVKVRTGEEGYDALQDVE